MEFAMGILIGFLLMLLLIGIAVWGMHMGLELAVDGTKKKGYFCAYGKKWKVVETPEA